MKRRRIKIGDYYILHGAKGVYKVTWQVTSTYWDEIVTCTPLNICKLTRLIYDIKD